MSNIFFIFQKISIQALRLGQARGPSTVATCLGRGLWLAQAEKIFLNYYVFAHLNYFFCYFELFICSFEQFFCLNWAFELLVIWTIFLLIWTIFLLIWTIFLLIGTIFLVIWTIFFMYYIILWVGCHAGAKLEGARPHPSLIKTKIKIKKKQLCKIPGSCYITWKIIISLFRGMGGW